MTEPTAIPQPDDLGDLLDELPDIDPPDPVEVLPFTDAEGDDVPGGDQ